MALRFALTLAWLALGPLTPCARAGAQDSEARQRYELEATLEPAERKVRGQVRITFRNSSARPLDALTFHLYMNAFRDGESVFMRESRGHMRGQSARGHGSIELETLTFDGRDALAHAERELVPGDRTQLRAGLERPLAPGESIAIESRFTVSLPPLFARSGYAAGDFFVVAQWFPKLAKLEPDGDFASFPYHALGEFYSDFADYALTVHTPRELAVVASGALVEQRPHGAEVSRRFEAHNVHDVAFVAARDFAARDERVDGVLVRYLAPPGYEQALPVHAHVVREGLRRFGRAYGSYPYPSLSVVLPPRSAQGGAGMEYPTLFLSEGQWFTFAALPSLSGAFVTAHELAHQWFQGMIASDEVRFPVLDEGLAQWASLDLMRTLYGAREGIFGLTFERFEVERLLSMAPTPSSAAGRAAHTYSASEYAASVYARASLALESIRRAYGRARFERALALYSAQQRFRHPTPDALAAAFDAVYGAGFAARVLRPLLLDGQTSSVQLADVRTRRRGTEYVTHVRARRSGSVALPTAIAAYDERGRELVRSAWPSDSDSIVTTLTTRAPVARVVADPDRALLLDLNVRDQVVRFARSNEGSLLARAVALVQALLAWVGP